MKVLVINVICSFKQCVDINYSQIDEKKKELRKLVQHVRRW